MTKINKLIEKYLDKKQEDDSSKHLPLLDNEFYASSVGGCPRLIYYSKVFPDRKKDPKSLKVFVLGNLVHDFLQKEVLSGESEVPLVIETKGVKIKGRLDQVDDNFIYEIKSVSTLRFVKEQPQKHHVLQLMLYLKAFKREKGKIVYVEKNTFDIIEHEIVFDEKIYDEAVEGFVSVFQSMSKNALPDKTSEEWACKHCLFKKECDGEVLK